MTATSPVLTVGIPTYNRREAVVRRLQELLEAQLPPSIEVLVIDNASPDCTADELAARFSETSFRVLANDTNLGFAGNLFRLFEEASTPYLLVTSDEDPVQPSALLELAAFCREREAHFVSPLARVGDNDEYRGVGQIRAIAPEEFEASSFYISGLTFGVDVARAQLPLLQRLVYSNAAVTVYPQVTLAALLVALGRSWHFDKVVTAQTESHQTEIVDPRGREYFTVEGRWSVFQGYESFFDEALSRADGEVAAGLQSMRETLRSGLPALLLGAAANEVPGLKPTVDALVSPPSLWGRMVSTLVPGR